MQLYSEGSVKFYASKASDGKISKELDVFYNPVMKFNRDVSILLLNALGRTNLQIADIMAGSGVRSLRFLKELNPGIIKKLYVNDYDATFHETMKKNLALNTIDYDDELIAITQKDANIFLRESHGFDYIDIDPFGSPNDFLDSAIIRISRKGILAVTATDTAPLCGTYFDACKRKYWAQPLHNYLMHEIGLRILIRKVQLVGVQYEKALIPIYSYARDHYFRVFFSCEKGKKACDTIMKAHEYVDYCMQCMHILLVSRGGNICTACQSKKIITAGPVWTGKLFDSKLAQAIAKSSQEKSHVRFLSILAEESVGALDHVGFYDIHELASKYKISVPHFETLIKKINAKGFLASRTIFSEYGIKTNMPIGEFVELLK